ncbi:hypothetical protein FRB95_010381 [Tulasnella sp. JGI-2019a]|nr:hypothetical protein FRB95_010381 [Tulasnella sp. JGI-2019a]
MLGQSYLALPTKGFGSHFLPTTSSDGTPEASGKEWLLNHAPVEEDYNGRLWLLHPYKPNRRESSTRWLEIKGIMDEHMQPKPLMLATETSSLHGPLDEGLPGPLPIQVEDSDMAKSITLESGERGSTKNPMKKVMIPKVAATKFPAYRGTFDHQSLPNPQAQGLGVKGSIRVPDNKEPITTPRIKRLKTALTPSQEKGLFALFEERRSGDGKVLTPQQRDAIWLLATRSATSRSDSVIAELCKVSPSTVSQIRIWREWGLVTQRDPELTLS